MTVPFMDAYVKLLIKTCHRRGVHAMVGVSDQFDKPFALANGYTGRYGCANPD